MFDNEKGHIVLFLPPICADRHIEKQKLPLEILALAGLLLEKGYRVVPIDGAIRENYIEEIMTACEGALCLGISCIFGYQVYTAAAVAKLIKERFPELPVVLGGWFPTVRPDLFLNEGLADVVVRGQGEITLMELAESYRNKYSIEEILGISYKREGQIVNNAARSLTSLNDLPPLPYQLISDDLESYIKKDPASKRLRRILSASNRGLEDNYEMRILWYYSSYGCPDSCQFCCSPGVTGRRWLAKDPVRVVDEVEELVKLYSYNILNLSDANFCVNENRVRIFCEEIIKRGLNIKWGATAEVHSIASYKDETLNLMAKSGCTSLFLGAETACAESMRLINKNIKVGQTEKSVSSLMRHNIIPDLSYVIGFPDQPLESIEKTIEEWLSLKFKYPTIQVEVRSFIPLPGSGFYSRALQLGYKEPEFPEGYKKEDYYFISNLIIENKALVTKIHRYRFIYLYWAYDILYDKTKLNFAQKILNRSARFRIKHKISVFPVEFWLYHIAAKLAHKLIRYDKK